MRLSAERLASTLPPLQIEAERVAMAVQQGVHGRRRAGTGDTFWQFRRYQTFDTARAVDWRRSAKSWRTYVRQTEWEAAQSVWLWCDTSPSMRYQSARNIPEKRNSAQVLTLALAMLLARGEENVALLGEGMRPRSGKPAIELVTDLMMNGADNAAGLPIQQSLPRDASLVWVSDFLSPPDEIEKVIGFYAARGVTGHMLQITDPAEESFPFRGRVRFTGLEGESPWLLARADNNRDAYADRFRDHIASLQSLAAAASWTFLRHHTDQPREMALMTAYGALSGRVVHSPQPPAEGERET